MTAHNPTPWSAVPETNGGPLVIDTDGEIIAELGTHWTGDEGDVNARRIAACVNACEGIDHPERLGPVIEYLRGLVDARNASVGSRKLAAAILHNLDQGSPPGYDAAHALAEEELEDSNAGIIERSHMHAERVAELLGQIDGPAIDIDGPDRPIDSGDLGGSDTSNHCDPEGCVQCAWENAAADDLEDGEPK